MRAMDIKHRLARPHKRPRLHFRHQLTSEVFSSILIRHYMVVQLLLGPPLGPIFLLMLTTGDGLASTMLRPWTTHKFPYMDGRPLILLRHSMCTATSVEVLSGNLSTGSETRMLLRNTSSIPKLLVSVNTALIL